METLIDSSVGELFDAQLIAYRARPNRSVEERKALLNTLRDVVASNADAIKEALWQDFRKPAAEVQLAEIDPVLGEIDFALMSLDTWAAPHEVITPPIDLYARSQSSIQYEPKGVCLIISPWNYPFLLSLGPVASCLAAGNRLILKPSELTPNSARLMAELLGEAFSPEDVSVVEGDKDMAQTLLNKPFHHIFFTGGTNIGRVVMQHAARNLSSCTLELGGKSPVIVDESADLNAAAQKIVWGKFINAGQTCIAPDYVLVHERVKDQLLGGLNAVIDHLYGTDDAALANGENYPAIVNDSHFNRLSRWTDEAVSQGAVVERGNLKQADRRFISPTILTNVDLNSTLMREEIFGPVLPVMTYTDLDDVITQINAGEKPLSLYFFSQQPDQINRVLSETSSGGACINDVIMHFFSPFLPFGGVNSSGEGRAHGFYGFKAFSNEKAVLKTGMA